MSNGKPTQPADKPAEKMVPEGQLVALRKAHDKQLTDLKGQLHTTQQKLSQAETELSFLRSLTDGDAEARLKELKDSIVKQNLDLANRESTLKEKETKLAEGELKQTMKALITEHGVTEEDLADCKTVGEMETKAVKLAYAKLKESKEPSSGQKGEKNQKAPGFEFGSSSGVAKPIPEMSDAEFAAHLKQIRAEADKR